MYIQEIMHNTVRSGDNSLEGRFVVISGNNKGEIFDIFPGKTHIVGRDPSCDICLSGKMVSRKHFSIFQNGDRFLLSDLDSRNGVYVNGEKANKHLLADRDVIRLGQVQLRFDLASELPVIPDDNSAELVEEDEATSTAIYRQKFEVDNFAPGDLVTEEGEVSDEQSRLMNICNLSNKLFTTKSIRGLLGYALESAIELTGAERASALLLDTRTQELQSVVTRFAGTEYCGQFPVSKTIVMETVRTAESVITGNASADERFSNGDSVAIDNLSSVMCVPMITLDSKVIGAIYVDNSSGFEAFNRMHLAVLASIAHQAAVAVERVGLFEDLEKLFIGAIHTLTASIEAKDEYTCGHSERVTCYSLLIADEMGLDSGMRDVVELAGIMHDVGKIGIPESVLCSAGKLSREEMELMQLHPLKGAEIIQNMPEISAFVSTAKIAEATRFHHERYDGTGYPDGLKGERIPLVSRILAVADAFDAITSNRSYRKGRDAPAAMKILSACTGIQIDPLVFKAFEEVYRKGKINWLEAVNVHFNLNVKRLRENTIFIEQRDN